MASFDTVPFGKPWLESANFLLGLELDGLFVECPKCSSMGMPMKKYVRGSKTNPMFMIHKNGSDLLHLCPLDKDETRVVRAQITLTERDLESIIEVMAPYVLFSGGLDSLCTLIYVQRIAQRIRRKVKVIHATTTVGLPGSINYVRKVCRELDVELQIVRPEIDFFTLAQKWGIPSHNSRWCCRELKIKPITNYLRTQSVPKVVLDGIRAAESSIRASYLPVWYHPAFQCISVSPIFYWSDKEVQDHIEQIDVPKEIVYGLGVSPECWCGAYKSRSDFEKLYHVCPELFNKLVELERTSKTGFTFIYENGKKVPLDVIK